MSEADVYILNALRADEQRARLGGWLDAADWCRQFADAYERHGNLPMTCEAPLHDAAASRWGDTTRLSPHSSWVPPASSDLAGGLKW
jgi:hypothetical protein